MCIITLHQPSAAVFAHLDDLYLLESGRLAFGGTVLQAEQYFTNLGFRRPPLENPADFYLDLVNSSPHVAAEAAGLRGPRFSEDATWAALYARSLSTAGDVPRATAALPAPVQCSTDAAQRQHNYAPPSKAVFISELERFRILCKKGLAHNLRSTVFRLRTVQLVCLVSEGDSDQVVAVLACLIRRRFHDALFRFPFIFFLRAL